VTESDIHHFPALAKMASISEEFLENVLLLIACLLLNVEGYCESARKKRPFRIYSNEKMFGGSSSLVWKTFNISKLSLGEGNG